MSKRESSHRKKSRSNKKNTVLTVRIKKEIDDILNAIAEKRNLTKAAVIREYLEKAKFFFMDHNSIKSLNENNLVLLKRRYFKKILSEFKEQRQIELATELARFINDLARLKGRIDDISYKLDLIEEYGFFPKFIDNEGYILIDKKFGPERFVEAFVWFLITLGDQGDFSRDFTTEEIEDSSRTRKKYMSTIQPVRRDASHYAFEFAKIENEKELENK
jgi:predicted DNA-binding protein